MKLARPIAYYLGISERATAQILVEVSRMPDNLQSAEHAKTWIDIAKRVVSLDCNVPFNSGFTRDYHRRQGSLSGVITAERLAEVLLHERSIGQLNQGGRHKAVIATLLRSFLQRSYPELSDDERVRILIELINTHIQVIMNYFIRKSVN